MTPQNNRKSTTDTPSPLAVSTPAFSTPYLQNTHRRPAQIGRSPVLDIHHGTFHWVTSVLDHLLTTPADAIQKQFAMQALDYGHNSCGLALPVTRSNFVTGKSCDTVNHENPL